MGANYLSGCQASEKEDLIVAINGQVFAYVKYLGLKMTLGNFDTEFNSQNMSMSTHIYMRHPDLVPF